MIARVGLLVSRVVRQVVPDSFPLAILLTLLVSILAIAMAGAGPGQVLAAWSGDQGIWSLQRFAMQMCLILVTGYAVATSPPVRRLSRWLAAQPETGAQAAALVAAVACGGGVINWGLGLIAGAFTAREVGVSMERRGRPVHYPLLAAAGFLGMMVWHGGLSGSAPLAMTRVAQVRELLGPNAGLSVIPLSETLFSRLNLVVTGGLLLLAPLTMALLSPRDAGQMVPPSAFGVTDGLALEDADEAGDTPPIPAFFEQTPVLALVLVAFLAAWAWRFYFPADGPSGARTLSPDSVNLTMLLVGLVLHRTPGRYAAAIESAVRGCAGIILQFPLYAGITGIMTVTGLTERFAALFGSLPDPRLLPLATFGLACLVNFFVPSGGAQWAVQGPLAISAALHLGVAPGRMVMAVAYGDQVTNMLQVFWALPLLAITRVRAGDIVGYTALAMLVAGCWSVLGLLFA
jgi:short-chain fatty acids transporter